MRIEASIFSQGTTFRSAAPLSRVWRAIMIGRSLHRERRALLALDQNLLRDVGLTRHQAVQEAARPLWDVPATWRL